MWWGKRNNSDRKVHPNNGGKMFQRLFADKKGKPDNRQAHARSKASRNQDENMYTTILASQRQQDLAEKINRILERLRVVVVEEKQRVIQNSKDKRGCSGKLLDYIKKDRVTGIVILSSEELKKLVQGSENLSLQITGEDVEFDSKILSQAFKNDDEVKKKILIVVPSGSADQLSSSINGVDVISLSGDENSWGDCIVAKFKKKNELR